MLMSVCYHMFSCISETTWRRFLTLDLMGISTAVLGTYLSGIYYSFYCHQVYNKSHKSINKVCRIGTTFIWHYLEYYVLAHLHYLYTHIICAINFSTIALVAITSSILLLLFTAWCPQLIGFPFMVALDHIWFNALCQMF